MSEAPAWLRRIGRWLHLDIWQVDRVREWRWNVTRLPEQPCFQRDPRFQLWLIPHEMQIGPFKMWADGARWARRS